MEKWSLAREKSNREPICSISKIQSFCCIPKIANKSLLSFLDVQMCFISSFTSERVDLPEVEREESVAMAEGYNYIKTLPSKQRAITLPHTLRSAAGTRSLSRLLQTCSEDGRHLRGDVISWTSFLFTSRNASVLTVPLKYPVFSENRKGMGIYAPWAHSQRAGANAKSRAQLRLPGQGPYKENTSL